MSASYFLSPHVHVCVAGKQVVLLDLKRDKYLSLAYEHPVGRWVRGWPARSPAPAVVAPPPCAPYTTVSDAEPENELLAKMLAQGMIVKDPAVGKEAAPVVTQQARTALVEYDLNVRPCTTFAQLRHLFSAHMAARWSLRQRPIKQVVEAASSRKSRGVRSSSLNIARVRPLVNAFVHLRPWLYTSRDACLLDSLTLVNFLAGYGVFPEWIFGVKTDPFYAHCWVQQGDFVFNDTPDHVRGFSPILVV
jgi:Transglutaminase-like superfamily